MAVYGIIGLPKSKDELVSNLKNNIRLGLDLKGGSHLVLQVQVQDAAKAEADRTIESLKKELRKADDRLHRDRPQRSADGRADGFDSDQYPRRPGVEDRRPAGTDRRQIPDLGSDRGEFDRLPAEHAADRPDRAEEGHGGAHHADHRAAHQRARA